ncbi:hypothetical protein GQ457_08G028000 [Hibiscus cannabinus]
MLNESLYSVFAVKEQGKPIWEVRTRYWKLREGENRLSVLLEGIPLANVCYDGFLGFPDMNVPKPSGKVPKPSVDGSETLPKGFETLGGIFSSNCKVLKPLTKVPKPFTGIHLQSWTFRFDSSIPRVTTSGRFCDWTGSRGGNEETLPPLLPVGGEIISFVEARRQGDKSLDFCSSMFL